MDDIQETIPTRVCQKHNQQREDSGQGNQVRKMPRQQRSKDMVQAILETSAELFAQLGYAKTTTNRIAARAGVSVGSLYQYFPNKDSLLAALMVQHHTTVEKIVAVALEKLANPKIQLEVGLRWLLTELIAFHSENPDMIIALSESVLRESPSVEAHHKGMDDTEMMKHVVTMLETRPDIRKGNYLAMATVLQQSIGQLTRWVVHDSPDNIAQSELVDEVVYLLTGYLEK